MLAALRTQQILAKAILSPWVLCTSHGVCEPSYSPRQAQRAVCNPLLTQARVCILPCLQVGTDVELLSIKAAQANAAYNAVADRLAVYQCSPRADAQEPLEGAGVAQEQRQFDVVVANILQVGGGCSVKVWVAGLVPMLPTYITGYQRLPKGQLGDFQVYSMLTCGLPQTVAIDHTFLLRSLKY